jgi:hypothetical protein
MLVVLFIEFHRKVDALRKECRILLGLKGYFIAFPLDTT